MHGIIGLMNHVVGLLLATKFNNNIIIQYGKTSVNGLQTISLPISYTTYYIGLSTTIRDAAADSYEGGNGFYVVNNTTCKVSPCGFSVSAYWMTIGY